MKRQKAKGLICSISQCSNKVRSLGFCQTHYFRIRRYGNPDTVLQVYRAQSCKTVLSDGSVCGKSGYSKDKCKRHYQQLYKHGDPLFERPPAKTSRSYIYIYKPEHPNAHRDGYIAEHRFIMAESLGRPLLKSENVHHKNGDGKDNRLENLELWNTAQPAGQRPEDKVRFAVEILSQYAPHLLKNHQNTEAW